jgi:CubicO group peptidase (beta-lactamase class C family)
VGLMMLNGGEIDGRRILSQRWVREATAEPHLPIAPNAATGYQHSWWTVPNSPAYAANGVGGQYIYVDPSTRTVIVKLSYIPNGVPHAAAEAMAFFKAAAAWKPD